MSATAKATTTDREFLDEMVQLIEGTHWTKSVLACVNIVNDRYPNGRLKYKTITVKEGGAYNRGTNSYEDLKVKVKVPKVDPATGRVVTKPTACLVGLVLRVQGHDWNPLDEDLSPDSISRLFMDYAEEGLSTDDDEMTIGTTDPFQEGLLNEQGKRVVVKIAASINDLHPSVFRGFPKSQEFWNWRDVVSYIESWNDAEETTRDMVKKVVIKARDEEEAVA